MVRLIRMKSCDAEWKCAVEINNKMAVLLLLKFRFLVGYGILKFLFCVYVIFI